MDLNELVGAVVLDLPTDDGYTAGFGTVVRIDHADLDFPLRIHFDGYFGDAPVEFRRALNEIAVMSS